MKRKLKDAICLIFDFNLSLILEGKGIMLFLFLSKQQCHNYPKKSSPSSSYLMCYSSTLFTSTLEWYSAMTGKMYLPTSGAPAYNQVIPP